MIVCVYIYGTIWGCTSVTASHGYHKGSQRWPLGTRPRCLACTASAHLRLASAKRREWGNWMRLPLVNSNSNGTYQWGNYYYYWDLQMGKWLIDVNSNFWSFPHFLLSTSKNIDVSRPTILSLVVSLVPVHALHFYCRINRWPSNSIMYAFTVNVFRPGCNSIWRGFTIATWLVNSKGLPWQKWVLMSRHWSHKSCHVLPVGHWQTNLQELRKTGRIRAISRMTHRWHLVFLLDGSNERGSQWHLAHHMTSNHAFGMHLAIGEPPKKDPEHLETWTWLPEKIICNNLIQKTQLLILWHTVNVGFPHGATPTPWGCCGYLWIRTWSQSGVIAGAIHRMGPWIGAPKGCLFNKVIHGWNNKDFHMMVDVIFTYKKF